MEFNKDESIEEMADILEVLDAICEYKGFDKAEFVSVKNKKAEELGAFVKKIILEYKRSRIQRR